MDEFSTTLVGFKRMAKEYFDALPTLDEDGVENGYKALGLAYLQSNFTGLDQHQAVIVLNLATKQRLAREIELEGNRVAW